MSEMPDCMHVMTGFTGSSRWNVMGGVRHTRLWFIFLQRRHPKKLVSNGVESRVSGSQGALEDLCHGRSDGIQSHGADFNGRTHLSLCLFCGPPPQKTKKSLFTSKRDGWSQPAVHLGKAKNKWMEALQPCSLALLKNEKKDKKKIFFSS